MRDFPSGAPITTDASYALLVINARYLSLEQQSEALVRWIAAHPPEQPFPQIFESLVSILHATLFDGILSNAGRYRQAYEPNSGYVGFGRGDVRKPSGSQFDGTPAPSIEGGLRDAFAHLTLDNPDPARSSILFYRRFVRVHPFYDANGRLGRAVVSVFLRLHRLMVQWKELETTRKAVFLKLLNECHKREADAKLLPEYEDRLVTFWRPFVIAEVQSPGL